MMPSTYMNDSSTTLRTITTANFIVETYLVRIVSLFGFIFNSFNLLIISNKKLTHYIYNFIWCKLFFNIVVCAFGMIYIAYECPNSCKNDYYTIIVSWANGITIRVVYFISQLTDILIMLNRYLLFKNKKNHLQYL